LAPVPIVEAPRVTFCHRDADPTKPYELITANGNAITPSGHSEHTGPIFPHTGEDGKWGDIIPAFTYNNGQSHFPGMNMTPKGETILAHDCEVEIEPETTTTTTTTTEPTTTTTQPGETTTTQPGEVTTTLPSETTTTVPETTVPSTTPPTLPGTTSTVPGGATTPTTAPASTTTITIAGETEVTALPPPLTAPDPPQNIMPPEQAVVVPAPNHAVWLGDLTVEERKEVVFELRERGGVLAATGATGTQPLTVGAVVAVMAGVAMVLGGRRRRR